MFKTKNVHPVLSWLTLLSVIVSYVICGVSIYYLFFHFKCMLPSDYESFQRDINEKASKTAGFSTEYKFWEVNVTSLEESEAFLTLALYNDPESSKNADNETISDCIPIGEFIYPADKAPIAGKILYSETTLLRGNVSIFSMQSLKILLKLLV